MDASTPAFFAPPDQLWGAWTPSDDVYQLALIAFSALVGEIVTSDEVCGRLLKSVAASDHLKGWIRDALGRRVDRFVDASEALAALRETKIEPARPPRSLEGQHAVFTGTLRQRRVDAQAAARRAGVVVQNKVNGATSVVVAGEPNPLQIGQKTGTKLFDAHHRIWRGQPISNIDEARFHRLTAPRPPRHSCSGTEGNGGSGQAVNRGRPRHRRTNHPGAWASVASVVPGCRRRRSPRLLPDGTEGTPLCGQALHYPGPPRLDMGHGPVAGPSFRHRGQGAVSVHLASALPTWIPAVSTATESLVWWALPRMGGASAPQDS